MDYLSPFSYVVLLLLYFLMFFFFFFAIIIIIFFFFVSLVSGTVGGQAYWGVCGILMSQEDITHVWYGAKHS